MPCVGSCRFKILSFCILSAARGKVSFPKTDAYPIPTHHALQDTDNLFVDDFNLPIPPFSIPNFHDCEMPPTDPIEGSFTEEGLNTPITYVAPSGSPHLFTEVYNVGVSFGLVSDNSGRDSVESHSKIEDFDELTLLNLVELVELLKLERCQPSATSAHSFTASVQGSNFEEPNPVSYRTVILMTFVATIVFASMKNFSRMMAEWDSTQA
eukprot:c18680_g1_i4.p1 GENE.c18680_g1_i4~~c18680_g1_i4.p1  ORF type:complete len:210 (+),score=19.85 c18680_g1_i4:58-687(+)